MLRVYLKYWLVTLAVLTGVPLFIFFTSDYYHAPEALVAVDAVDIQPDEKINSDSIDRFVIGNLHRTGLPGVSLVITKGAKIVHAAGYGKDADGKQITTNTRNYVGSVSKSFTALAVMQLADQGKIDIHKPVATYLPDFKTSDPRSASITIKQLLNQSSGLSDGGFPEMSLPQPKTPDEEMVRLQQAMLVADPGSSMNYHNPNYHILARLVEVVSGGTFGSYLTNHVFAPIGMRSSGAVDFATQNVSDLANGHTFFYGQVLPRPVLPHFVAGSGGVISTAHDMGLWLCMQNNAGVAANGTKITSAKSITLMHTPSGPDNDYAFGWERDIMEGNMIKTEHTSALFTYSSDQTVFPATGYGFALLFNSCSAFGIEQMSFIDAMTNIVQGQKPEYGLPGSLILDIVFAELTAIVALIGIHRVRRHYFNKALSLKNHFWKNVFVICLNLAPIFLLIYLPKLIGSLLGGRNVTWESIFYGLPSLAIFLFVLVIINLMYLGLRLRKSILKEN